MGVKPEKGGAPRLPWSLLLRLVRMARPCSLRVIFRFFGVGCILVAWALTLTTLHVYYSVVFPLLVDLRSWPGRFMFLPATWLSFNILFNYAMVILTKPGKPTGGLTDQEIQQMEQEQAPKKGQGWAKFCKHCKLPKPARSHHCHACGACVLRMDHHCPWIGQCVGHYNHRYFMLFIVYLGASCLWACITLGLHRFGWLRSQQDSEDSFSALLFTFAICMAVFLAMFAFFLWNAYLLITNQTTIEWHYNRSMKDHMKERGSIYMNPYDIGITRNLQQVFGPYKSVWAIFLPSTMSLPNDGTRWPTITQPVEDYV